MSVSLRKTDTAIVEEIRRKLKLYGVKALEDTELLCILLQSGDELKNVRELSQILLRRYGSLMNISAAEGEELIERNSGITERKAALLLAAFELGRRSRRQDSKMLHITGAESVFKLMSEEYAGYDRECFKSILLTSKNDIIAIDDISVGTLSSSPVHVREVFKRAVMKSAYSIIITHNHPSGDPAPSANDDSVTNSVKRAGEVMGIRVLDHVIIGAGKYYSYSEKAAELEPFFDLMK